METQQTTSSKVSSASFDLDKYAGKNVPLPKASLDVASLIKNTALIQAQQSADSVRLQNVYGQAADASKQAADLNIDLGANAALIEQVRLAGQLETQSARDKAAADLGTDYRLQGQKLTELSDQIHSSKSRMDAASAKIREKQSVSFFDNPLGWLVNQVSVNSDIDEYNLAEEDSNRAHNEYIRLNQETQSAAATQNAISHSISEASVKAATDNIALTARQKQLEGTAQALGYNALQIKTAYEMDGQKLQYEFSTFNARKAEEQNKIALAHLQLAKDEAQTRVTERLKKEGAESDIIDSINKGRTARLGPQAQLIVPGSMEANKIIEIVKSNSPFGKQYMDDYNSGEQFKASGIKTISPSPADFADMVSRKVPIYAPGSEPVQQFIMDQASQVAAEAKQSGTTKPEAVKAALNSRVESEIARQAKNIDWSSQKNLFNLPNYGDYINSPTLKDLPVVKNVIAPIVQAGGDLTDPNKLIAVVGQAVIDKKITYGQALEATTVIQQGVAINAAQKQFMTLGIVPPRSYNVEVKQGTGVFSRSAIVDLTKPDQFGRALIKYTLTAKGPGSVEFNRLFD